MATGNYSSSSAPLTCGVPQRSILGPLPFSIYSNCSPWDISSELTMSIFTAMPTYCSCISRSQPVWHQMLDVKKLLVWSLNLWSLQSFNSHTTTIMNVNSALGSLSANVKSNACNLGVIFNSELSFDGHVTLTVQSCFIHLRHVSKIRSLQSATYMEKMIHALITSRLYYCNVLCSSLQAMNSLQEMWPYHSNPCCPSLVAHLFLNRFKEFIVGF